eukprot:10932353-Lingulodinium_polyedra.AAC.1
MRWKRGRRSARQEWRSPRLGGPSSSSWSLKLTQRARGRRTCRRAGSSRWASLTSRASGRVFGSRRESSG